jgi:uncharacterized SAM-binding protein YcdF (DUF218 family)
MLGLAGLGLLVLIVSATPLVKWWAGLLAGPWTDAEGDILIVLTGSLTDPDILGQSSYWRAVYATMAWRGGHFRRIVVSGGGSPVAAAELMRNFMAAHGVPTASIELEPRALSTRESAIYTTALLAHEPGRKVLLTSDFHMYRTWRAFRKAGLETTPRPFPDVRKRALTWTARWPAFLDLVVETAKLGYYYWRGWI